MIGVFGVVARMRIIIQLERMIPAMIDVGWVEFKLGQEHAYMDQLKQVHILKIDFFMCYFSMLISG